MRKLADVALAALLLVGCSSPPVRTAPPDRPPPVRAPDPPAPGLRLPGDVRPAQYDLDLTIVPDNERAVGRMRIDARVERPTRVVWLNATGLAIGAVSLAGSRARIVNGDDDMFGITLDRELPAGTLAIDITFETPIERTKSVGLYAEKEGDATYAYTFFEPIDARRAFPCFDEPNYKVPWKLTFHVRRDHTALANAAVVRELDEPGDMKRVELAVSKPLPSYLVAFVVGPFELIDGGVAGRIKTPVRFVIPRGRSGELRWAKEVTPKVVAALEDYFDMPYPYGKLDVAVVPRFWGTMEHPGIVAMGQPLTLIRPDQETRSRKQRYANILAHELAHYWFGDYVTMAWWDDTWLNESLGEWMDSIITNAVEPAWKFPDRRVDSATGAMDADEALATPAIRKPVDTKEGISASFDGAITYQKGGSVLRMFEAWMGPDRWREMMRGYVRKHAWGTASADDLFRAVRDGLGAETEQAMRTFFEQPGVPRISAQRTCPATGLATLALAQTRSLPAGVTDPTARLWKLPVCVRYGDDKGARRACWPLEQAEAQVALELRCPTWMILNADATGYYRSAVDVATVKALLTPGSAIARSANPTAAEKMMLIADLRAAVDRDELQLDKLLELVPVIAADPDERIAGNALDAGGFSTEPLDDALYAKAERFWLRAYGPAAKKLGWARAKGDSDERHELRRRMVAAVAHLDPAFAKPAEVLVDKWLADRTGIDDDLVDTALSATARFGDRARFDAILGAARKPRDRTEKARLLAALGSFRDPALVQDALTIVRGTEFDLRDSAGILWRILGGRTTAAAGTAFVQAHLDDLLSRMRGDDEATWLLGGLAGLSCAPERRKVLADLVGPRAKKHPGAQAAVDRGLEKSAQCIALHARQLPALQRFLTK
ncbi:MAG: M1 family metallopeptidase [Deltaproteobacteria bacterium]|nr:M1 family metallopeptidase [Deltaproteobacteria bacterium]